MSLLEVTQDAGIVTLRLNDPARSNLLSSSLCRALIEQVKLANANPETRAIVIRASGKAFCAGADLEDLKAASQGDTAAVQQVYDAFLSVADSPLPTIAVIEGPAVGAGMNLALACDLRIASVAGSFDTRFLQIGLHPGGGHAWMLLRAIGWQQACRFLLLGTTVNADEAARIGLVAATVADADLEPALLALLNNVRRTPRELLKRTKQSLRDAVNQSHAQAYRHETDQQMWSLQQPAFSDLVAKLQRKLTQR